MFWFDRCIQATLDQHIRLKRGSRQQQDRTSRSAEIRCADGVSAARPLAKKSCVIKQVLIE
jgi:hypothetical protein